MVITENDLRVHLARNGLTAYRYSKGDYVTQPARDFARERGIVLEESGRTAAGGRGFVDLSGRRYAQKPEHMTHLHGNVLVLKTHPRIALRGQLDTLQAALLQAQWTANRQMGERGQKLIGQLQEVLDFVRQILACEVKECPLPVQRLLGRTLLEVRDASHFPPGGHTLPDWRMGEAALQLNMARTLARQAELAAARAFIRPDGTVEREDLLCALNRTSSALYLLYAEHK